MASVHANLPCRPGSNAQIAKAVFWSNISDAQIEALQSYYEYYIEELELLQKGISPGSWQATRLAIKTFEDIVFVIETLRHHKNSRRPVIQRDLLSKIPPIDPYGANCSINLALRLWLMVNVQEPEFMGLRSNVDSLQWNDEQPLSEFLHTQFPKAQWKTTAQSSRLGPHFTAAFMNRVCALRIEWTTSLHDHLRLDLQRKALRVFPYKCHLQALIDSHQNRSNGEEYV